MKKIAFSNGDQIPLLGLGTWKSQPGEVFQAVLWAINCGYRHIDCAFIYNNEKEVGNALKQAFQEGLVTREEMFITSKLWNDSHRREDVKPALKKSLRDLKLDYLDLYLVHWPISFKPKVGFAQTREQFFTYSDVPLEQTWAAMEEIQNLDLARHIGVSNFNRAKLEEIQKKAIVKPEMNQIELHPYLPQEKLVEYCKSKGILVTAYAPLGSSDRASAVKKSDEPSLLENELIQEIANRHGAHPAQILIAWSIQKDIAVIPKSVNEERIKQNFEAGKIQLNEKDIADLKSIGNQYRFIDGRIFTGPQSPYSPKDLWELEEF